MKLLTSAALAGAVFVSAIGYSTLAPAAPAATGARALDAAAQGTPVVEVQGRGKRGAGNNNRGNNQNANRGGGNNNQADRDRRRKRDRDAAIAAGVVGVLGGLLLSTQAQPEPVYEEPRLRCRYGSYVNRRGERRCRRQ